MLQTVTQRPHDLRLAVIHQQSSVPILTPLRRCDLSLGRWRVRFCIIGESHQVQVWRDYSLQFTEMLACIDVAAAKCLHYHTFDTLKEHYHHTPQYDVRVTFESTPRSRPQSEGYLHFAFPMVNGVLPVTEIHWWTGGDYLRWWTLHVYPQAQTTTYVYSESKLKID